MEEYKRYTITGDKLKLGISLVSYDISIKGYKGDELVIEVDDRKKADKNIEIEFTEKELRIKEEKSLRWNKGGNLVLHLPKNGIYSGKYSSTSGDIEVRDIFYEGKIASVSGDIELKKIEGMAEIKSVSGDITLEEVNLSKISANKVSGNFDFSGKLSLSGDGGIKTVSGDIKLDIKSGDNLRFYLKTLGDTDINGESIEWKEEMADWKSLTLKSVSGSINLTLDESLKDVYLKTSKGMKGFKMNTFSKWLEVFLSHIPKGVQVQAGTSKKEHISRILNMLEHGKIDAEEAKKLIDSL